MPGFNTQVRQHFKGQFRPWPRLMALLMFCSGCAFHKPLLEQAIGDFGRVVFDAFGAASEGFVVGVLHGAAEPEAIDYANTISDATGAGLVIAYGFKANRIAVAQPLIHQKRPPRLYQHPRPINRIDHDIAL